MVVEQSPEDGQVRSYELVRLGGLLKHELIPIFLSHRPFSEFLTMLIVPDVIVHIHTVGHPDNSRLGSSPACKITLL